MGDDAVKVVVRCRPMNSREVSDSRVSVVDVNVPLNQVTLRNPNNDAISAEPKSFTFDAVYDEASTQRAVYDETAYPLVEAVLSGYNGTIFAYGQTGCGKTHTMQGRADPPELRGVIPNSFDHIFDHIKLAKDTEFLVRCSYLEIYNEEIRDLLVTDATNRLELHEDRDRGVFVKDLTQVVVDSAAAIDKVMNDGNKHRTTGATLMNAESSRSHSIFTIIIETSSMRDGREHICRGKLNLVDLAGSERPSKTGATGARMKEGIKINLSLTALGNVISALVEGGKNKHIPYRDSKLTRLLQDSLGGNTKTVMVAAIGPADYNYEETLSTLRYANRAKNIKNTPIINEDPKDALLRQYKEEIERLRSLLVQHLAGAGLAPEALQAILASANALSGGGGASLSSSLKAMGQATNALGAVAAATPRAAVSAAADASAAAATPAASATAADAGTAVAAADGTTSSSAPATTGTAAAATSGSGSASGSGILDGAAIIAAGLQVPASLSRPSSRAASGTGSGLSATTAAAAASGKAVEGGAGAAAAVEASNGVPGTATLVATAMLTSPLTMPQASAPSPSAANNEAQEALEAARRDAERERKEREELARKLLALQHMVVGHKPGKKGTGKKGAAVTPVKAINTALGDDHAALPSPDMLDGSLDLDGALDGVGVGGDDDDEETVKARQREELRRQQQKARLAKKKEAQLLAEQQQQAAAAATSGAEGDAVEDEEMGGKGASGTAALNAGTTSGLTADRERALIRRVRAKYSGRIDTLTRELADAREEHASQRETLMNTVREQAKEAKLLEALVSLFLSPMEMTKVWERAVWNEETEKWTLPRIKPRDGLKVRNTMAKSARAPAPQLRGANNNGASDVEQNYSDGGAEYNDDDDGGAEVSDTEVAPSNRSSMPKIKGVSGSSGGAATGKRSGRPPSGADASPALPSLDAGGNRSRASVASPSVQGNSEDMRLPSVGLPGLGSTPVPAGGRGTPGRPPSDDGYGRSMPPINLGGNRNGFDVQPGYPAGGADDSGEKQFLMLPGLGGGKIGLALGGALGGLNLRLPLDGPLALPILKPGGMPLAAVQAPHNYGGMGDSGSGSLPGLPSLGPADRSNSRGGKRSAAGASSALPDLGYGGGGGGGGGLPMLRGGNGNGNGGDSGGGMTSPAMRLPPASSSSSGGGSLPGIGKPSKPAAAEQYGGGGGSSLPSLPGLGKGRL